MYKVFLHIIDDCVCSTATTREKVLIESCCHSDIVTFGFFFQEY